MREIATDADGDVMFDASWLSNEIGMVAPTDVRSLNFSGRLNTCVYASDRSDARKPVSPLSARKYW